MLRRLRTLFPIMCLGTVACFIVSCESTGGHSGGWQARLGPVPVTRTLPPEAMLREVNLRQDMIKKGTYGRRYFRPMNVGYITIHATENPTGNAYNHALALKRGALRARKRPGGNRIGFLTWHFTVQEDVAIQHLPTNEQGEHADFDGPGNNRSIGIEMCEHKGNDLARTIDRTAKLAAFLMHEHNVPISRVVPHYHWPRRGASPPHKNCPHFLLDNGRPGATWRWFLDRVEAHHSRLVPGPVPRI
jgi:N-acetylmuramoyl-L-alanine amidase